ncbi:MAG: DUF4129 domain-containing protein [Nitrososphaerota archaeon]|nr:DUF4129 domain-containing protein [Nitrososphaerota archaeon]
MILRRPLALVLAVSVIVVATVSAVYANSPPRQVDPSTVQQQNPYPPDLLSFYANLVRSLGAGNFSLALSELNSTGLIQVPAQLQFVYSRFNSLLSQATRQLQQVNSSIQSANSYLSYADFSSANSSILAGYVELSEANLSVVSLQTAAPQMESSFGLPTGQLQGQVNDLSKLISSYKISLDTLSLRLDSLESQIQSGALHFTRISLSSSSTSVKLGSPVTLTGTLSLDNGTPLSGKSISLLSSLGSVSTVTTGPGGSFSYNTSIPFVYSRSVTFQARYSPSGNDVSFYLPSQSDVVYLNLVFYQPVLSLNGPRTLLPGGTYNFSGSYENGSSQSSVVITAFGRTYSENTSNGGHFSINLTVPTSVPDGAYSIQAQTPSHGLFAPASQQISVNVQRLKASVTVSVPPFVVGGETIAVYGSVASSNGTYLAGSEVSVSFSGVTANTNTSKSGNFVVSIPVPLLVGSGSNHLTVVAAPTQPWVSAASTSVSTFAIDPLTVVVPVILLLAAAVVYRQRRAIVPPSEEGVESAKSAGPIQSPISTEHEIKAEAKARSELTQSYFDVVGLLSVKGFRMKPSMTPSEFSDIVSSGLPVISNEFRTLTTAFEDEVYGFGASEDATHESLALARYIMEKLR